MNTEENKLKAVTLCHACFAKYTEAPKGYKTPLHILSDTCRFLWLLTCKLPTFYAIKCTSEYIVVQVSILDVRN